MIPIQVRRIQDALADIKSRGDFTQLEPPHLLLLTRHLLESQRAQGTYPVLNLYSNWCAHSRLDRSRIGYLILRQITAVIADDIRDETVAIAKPGSGVSAALAIGALREQLITLFTFHDLDTYLFTGRNFRRFMGAILDAIESTPLSFPDRRRGAAARQYADIEQLAQGTPGRMIIRLTVTKDLEPEQLSFFGVAAGTYAWQLETAAGTTFCGVLHSATNPHGEPT